MSHSVSISTSSFLHCSTSRVIDKRIHIDKKSAFFSFFLLLPKYEESVLTFFKIGIFFRRENICNMNIQKSLSVKFMQFIFYSRFFSLFSKSFLKLCFIYVRRSSCKYKWPGNCKKNVCYLI